MRIIAFSDLQLERFREFSGINELGFDRRAYNMISRIDELIMQQHEEGKIDAIVMAGDIFNNKELIEVDITHLIHSFVVKWRIDGIRVILLVGNHDLFLRDGSITSLSQFEGYCDVIHKGRVMDVAGVPIAFSPFREAQELIEYDISTVAEDVSNPSIMFGHWTVKGASTGDFTLDEGIDPSFPALTRFERVYLGDIHKSQRIGNCLYLGSPAQLNFGERGQDKFIWLITETGETPINTSLPQFVIETDPGKAKALRAAGHYVRFDAKSRESAQQASLIDGIRIEHNWFETVAKDSAKMVTTISSAVAHYADAQARPDIAEMGQGYVKDLLTKQAIPAHSVVLRSIKAANFFSYPSILLKLDEKRGLILLHGEVITNSEYDSNGAGKTTIFETILYALYGITLRYKNVTSAIVRKGQEEAAVSLEFSIGDKHYLVERGTSSGLQLYSLLKGDGVVGQTSLSHTKMDMTQKAINSLVGDKDYFLRLTLLALHAQPSFLSLPDGEKKDFIDTFSGLKVFDEARNLVNVDITSVVAQISETEGKISALTATIEANRTSLTSVRGSLEEFDAEEDRKERERESEVENLTSKKNAITLLQEIATASTPLVTAVVNKKAAIKQLRIESESVSSKKKAISEMKEAIEETKTDKVARLSPLSTKKTELEASLKEPEKPKACASCGRPFDKNTNEDTLRNHLRNELKKLEPLMAAIIKEVDPVISEAASQLAVLEGELKKLVKENADAIGVAETELEGLEKARTKEIDDASNVRVKNARARAEISRIEENIERLRSTKRATPDHLQSEINRLTASIAESQQASIDHETSRNQLLDRRGKLDFWLKGFSNTGCKSLLYTSIIDRLNQFLQQNCNVLSGGVFTLRLLPFTENKSSKTESSKISVEVLNSSGSDILSGDSLGEKARIDIAVNLALRSVLQESTGLNFNLFFADEPWLGLDDSGKLSAYKLFHAESQKVDNFIVTDQSPFTKGSQDSLSWTARKTVVAGVPVSELVTG